MSFAAIKLFVVRRVLRLQNALLGHAQAILYRRTQIPQRILIFRTGSLGDSLCAIPSIRAIRTKYSSAQLDILTNAGSKNLVGLHFLLEKELFDDIIDYQGVSKKELFLSLKKKNTTWSFSCRR